MKRGSLLVLIVLFGMFGFVSGEIFISGVDSTYNLGGNRIFGTGTFGWCGNGAGGKNASC
jgi:hypothetical protein